MSTFTQFLYQIVFSTKHREPTLTRENRPLLFRYFCGILQRKNCRLYRINGVEDHVHILTHIHPSIALADLVKSLKLASSEYIKEQKLFSEFRGWQIGYGAFTYSQKEKEVLIAYVKNQEKHHRLKTFPDELRDLLQEHGIAFDERYLL